MKSLEQQIAEAINVEPDAREGLRVRVSDALSPLFYNTTEAQRLRDTLRAAVALAVRLSKQETSECGNGWRMLVEGEVIEATDEYASLEGIWKPAYSVGNRFYPDYHSAYRRRIPATETAPTSAPATESDGRRMLVDGEVIQAGDEFKHPRDGWTFTPHAGDVWRERMYFPFRRRVPTPSYSTTPEPAPMTRVEAILVCGQAGCDAIGCAAGDSDIHRAVQVKSVESALTNGERVNLSLSDWEVYRATALAKSREPRIATALQRPDENELVGGVCPECARTSATDHLSDCANKPQPRIGDEVARACAEARKKALEEAIEAAVKVRDGFGPDRYYRMQGASDVVMVLHALIK